MIDNFAVANFDHSVANRLSKLLIMSSKQHRAREGDKGIVKSGDGLEIEVIGGSVEH